MCKSDLIIYAQCGHNSIKYYMLEGKVVPETSRRCDKYRNSGDSEIPAGHVTLAHPYIRGFEMVVPGPCHKCKWAGRRGDRSASTGENSGNDNSKESNVTKQKEDNEEKEEAKEKEKKSAGGSDSE